MIRIKSPDNLNIPFDQPEESSNDESNEVPMPKGPAEQLSVELDDWRRDGKVAPDGKIPVFDEDPRWDDRKLIRKRKAQ